MCWTLLYAKKIKNKNKNNVNKTWTPYKQLIIRSYDNIWTLHRAGLYRFYPLHIIQGPFNFGNYIHDKRWHLYTLSVANSILRTTNTAGDDLYMFFPLPIASSIKMLSEQTLQCCQVPLTFGTNKHDSGLDCIVVSSCQVLIITKFINKVSLKLKT